MAKVHSFLLATRAGRTTSPSVVVPANVKLVAISLSGFDLTVLQDSTTHFTLGIEYLAPDNLTWHAATCTVDGVPSLVAMPLIGVRLSTTPGETIRAFIDSTAPLTFSGSVDVS